MFESVPGGVVGKIDFTNDRVNGLLVDVAANLLSFCNIYTRNFKELESSDIPARLSKLNERIVAALQKYPEDRDPEVLAGLTTAHVGFHAAVGLDTAVGRFSDPRIPADGL